MNKSAAEENQGIPSSFFQSLETVSKGLEEAKKMLEQPPHKALNAEQKRDFLEAQKMLNNFITAFNKVEQDAKEIDVAKPLKDLAHSMSFRGKVENFAKDQVEALENKVSSYASKFMDNKICNAIGNVIKSACNFVSVTVQSQLKNAVAAGEFAKSIVELGKATMQTEKTAPEPGRGR